jgi:hypothetical protein
MDLLRSTFGTSRLVRLLGEWTPVEPEAGGMDFAERLSLSLDAFDAIRLQSAQQAIRAMHVAPVTKPSAARRQDLAADLKGAHGTLARAIAQDPVALAGLAPEEVTYAVFRERHADLQRQMDLLVKPLRDHVRQALARTSPRLRQLAALDAVLEEMLAPREQALLPATATLLRRRFEQLRAEGRPQHFINDWRQALLAELDLRLEPVAGMIDALANASRKQG